MLFLGRSMSTPRRLCSLAPRTTRRSATEVPSKFSLLTGHRPVPGAGGVAAPTLGRGTDNFGTGCGPCLSVTGCAHLRWSNQVWFSESCLAANTRGLGGMSISPEASVQQNGVPAQRRAGERPAAERAVRLLPLVREATERLELIVAGLDEHTIHQPS